MSGKVTEAFTKALPKAELHAHLTGSISPQCLHEIWLRKQSSTAGTHLEDPLIACRPPTGEHHDVLTFFPVFDKYIYNLCNDTESVAYATERVLQDFEADGVRYLELRTTPREVLETDMTKEIYVRTVLEAIERHGGDVMSTFVILSVDRRNTIEQAMETVQFAKQFKGIVVGVDLCGNPMKGDVAIFRKAFELARSYGLKITLHFAEVPQSSTALELKTLLDYQPDRIGHVIHVPKDIQAEIESRRIGLELCLSCNVNAKMLPGAAGFSEHHFGDWRGKECPVALCTDDVGIFGSPLSNEYFLAARHFDLTESDLERLCRKAIASIFGGEAEQIRLHALLDKFENIMSSRGAIGGQP